MNTPTSHGTLFRDGAEGLQLRYYMFDWDDNILRMPTKIHLDRRTDSGAWEAYDVSTGDFAKIRRDTVNYRPRDGSWDAAFEDFYDNGARGEEAFIDDVKTALADVLEGREKPMPSFQRFKDALVESRLFAIITARSHNSSSIRRGVEYFIEHAMTEHERRTMIGNERGFMRYFGENPDGLSDAEVLKHYLDFNHYSGVSSPEFQRRMGREGMSSAESPEKAKQFAIHQFVYHIVSLIRDRGAKHPVSIGFSDDDIHNVMSVENYLREALADALPNFKFVVYDTSEAGAANGRKVVIRSA
jgi:hypothetical protein